jgi:phosphonate transport system substrate-binding protein
VIVGLPLLLAAGVVGYVYYTEFANVGEPDILLQISHTVLSPTKLAEDYTDADNDFVADTPTDPAKLIDHDKLEKLTFSTLNAPERDQKEWADFLKHLAKVTGKEIEHVQRQYTNSTELADVKEGRVQILAANTGVVPTLVNNAGFVPMFVMANKDGKYGYEVKFIVPADSPAQSLKDLKDKQMAVGALNSNSSFKAPVLMFWNEQKQIPKFFNAGGQERCIAGVANKEPQFDFAAVASDYLERKLGEGKANGRDLKREQIRVLSHPSPTYPPQCFGIAHNLKPDMAAKIREAFTTFDWKDSSLEKAYQASNQVKFVEIKYQEAWKPVRDIDDTLNKLVEEARAKKSAKK